MKKVLCVLTAFLLVFCSLAFDGNINAAGETFDNLVLNGDGNGIDGKLSYTAEDEREATYAGEIMKGRPYGWRVLGTTYVDAQLLYPHTFETGPDSFQNYSKTAVLGVNKWKTLAQDIEIESGKYYRVSAKLSIAISKSNQSGRYVALFIDDGAGSAENPTNKPTDKDWYTRKILECSATHNAQNSNDTTVYYYPGDFTDHAFTFSSDELIDEYNLSKNADGKYTVRLVVYNYSDAYAIADDIMFYEISSDIITINTEIEKQGEIYPGYICTPAEQKAVYGEDVTVSAIAYEKNEFLGWYENGVLVSNEATYKFSALQNRNLTAKFTVKNLFIDAGGENTKKDTSLSHDLTSWFVTESSYDSYGFDVVATEITNAFDGKTVYSANHRTMTYGTTVSGLKTNRNYVFSFWWNFSQNGNFTSAIIEGLQTKTALATGMGGTADGTWQQVIVPFNSGENTSIKISFLYTAGHSACMMDNFALYEANNVGIYCAAGGTVSSNLNDGKNGPAADGQVVTAVATALDGNRFKGWYNYENLSEVLSTDPTYTFTVTDSKYIIAYFEGPTAEPVNYFVDGDFENNAFQGITFSHPFWESDWCNYSVIKTNGNKSISAVSGDKFLSVLGYSRYSNVLIDNLKPATDYTLSFYYDSDPGILFDFFSVIRYRKESGMPLDQDSKGAFYATPYQYNLGISDLLDNTVLNSSILDAKQNGGWKRMEISFNTGNRDCVLLHWSMTKLNGSGMLYFDDFRLTEGNCETADVANGDFESDNKKGWQGDFTTAKDGKNTYGITASEIYNSIKLDKFPALPYEVRFKAKSDENAVLALGLADAGALSLTDENGKINTVTNEAYHEIELTADWQEYCFTLPTTAFESFKLFIKSQNGGKVMIDDVKIAEASRLATIHSLSFEANTDREILTGISLDGSTAHNDKYYKITDEEAHSGASSLMMTAGDAEYKSHPLSQNWSSLKLLSGRRYNITFWAKANISGDKFTFSVNGTDTSYNRTAFLEKTITLQNTEWTRFSYDFTAYELGAKPHCADIIFNGLAGQQGNIYFDDVVISESQTSVLGTADALFTEDVAHNYFSNPNFEKDDSRINAFVKNDDAYFGERYLSFKAGDKLIIPVSTRPEYYLQYRANEYTFAVSVRGGNESKGIIGLSYSSDGKELLKETNGNLALISTDTDGKWMRKGYNFTDNRWTNLYLVIECTEGAFDIDYVSLCNKLFAKAENVQEKKLTVSFDNSYTDMSVYDKGNFISGNIEGLPTGSSVVLLGETTYEAAINSDGRYDIVNIANGKYQMLISTPDCEYMTVWGDLVVTDNGISGLACKRLDGTATKISGAAVRNGIVKIVDDKTGYAYFAASDNKNKFTAYVLDCNWYIEGTTNEPSALKEFGLNLSRKESAN